MDFRKTLGRSALALVVSCSLAACGGGSTGLNTITNDAMLPPLVTAKSCNNITGQLDAVQSALLGQLRPAAQSLPAIGAPAAGLTTALAQQLDTVDALSNALSTLASTRNPQLFTAQLSGVGDSLLCAGSSVSDALAQLAANQSTPVPGLAAVQGSLALVSQRIADGLVGTRPGGDLTVLTNQLLVLSAQLQGLSSNLPLAANQPYLQQLLALNASTYAALARILNDAGALNGTQLAADVTALLVGNADTLQAQLASLGVPANTLSPVTTQLRIASQALNTGLAAVAAPTLQAVSAVLGGVNATPVGSAASSFADLLDGGLTAGGSPASLARVSELTQQLNGAGGLSLVTALLQSFGGLLPG